MNIATFGFVSALITFCNCYKEHYENVTSEINVTEDLSGPILSRRKRFLVFPDGSSFQLVFCTQNHGYLQIGDIVWFGSTAALAWELPSDPSIFNMFKEQSKIYGGNRRIDKNVYYLNEDGRVIGKVPYRRKTIVNPAFAKRSVDSSRIHISKSVKKMHDIQKNTNYLNDLNEKSIEFHRTARKSLFTKLETVFQALGWNGTECVLRMLCESGQEQKDQGTFLSEIIRATFRLPKGREFEGHKRYDMAHGARACASSYPGCEDLHGSNLFEIKDKQ